MAGSARGLTQKSHLGSLGSRMILTAAAWITLLLLGGGYALDRVLTNVIIQNNDDTIDNVLTQMIASAEVDETGEIFLNREPSDPRFVTPNSGLYWQISGAGHKPFPSRSLWERLLTQDKRHIDGVTHLYDSNQFGDGELLRIAERDIILPTSKIRWRFQVAQVRTTLDQQIARLRKTLIWSFSALALGLIILAALQTLYGLWPLRRLRLSIAAMRDGQSQRVELETLPSEVAPLVYELNALLDHNEQQAMEAREHAGNLAHALKTPLTVVMNAATAEAPDLAETVIREAATMRRQVDHHLARARAVGRRGHAHSRAIGWTSLESVIRALSRLYPDVRFDSSGEKELSVHVERQDLDEMLGNLVENAAKYGGGSVFVTVEHVGNFGEFIVEDDGAGIPDEDRARLFNRGVRLDSSKPGTGLGLAIVRDVAEIYGGSVALEESEDLGGVLVRLKLPAASS
jgi:signal transduction histidine kinase